MNKHISMRFDFVEEHVVNIKSIATKVGAVSRGMKSCSSVLKRGNTVSDSLHRQVEVTRNNVKLINQSLIDVHITLAKVRDLYYKAEKQNYTAISGKKPYEDLNVFEKIKYYGEKVGRAVVTKIDNCITSLKDYLPGGKYWEVVRQTTKLVAVATVSVIGLATAMIASPMSTTKSLIRAKNIISRLSQQSRNWAYSMTGEYDKIEDLSWLDIGLSAFKSSKNISELKPYKDLIEAGGNILDYLKIYDLSTAGNHPPRSLGELLSKEILSVINSPQTQGNVSMGDFGLGRLSIGVDILKCKSKLIYQN